MTLFKNPTAQEVWIQHWCERCYRNGNCDIITKALRTGRKPPEWDRNERAQTMAERLRCNEFSRKPPAKRRWTTKQYEDVSMFDDDTLHSDGRRFVPVPGWPERPEKKEGDHA